MTMANEEIAAFLSKNNMIDCRQNARITEEACKVYRETNWKSACIGCSRCPPGVTGGSGSDSFRREKFPPFLDFLEYLNE